MRGKTDQILRMYSDGLSQAEIARKINCSPANVSLTLKRHGAWDHTVRKLPRSYQTWLLERAKKLRKHPGDTAAKLLVEIIDIYKSGDV